MRSQFHLGYLVYDLHRALVRIVERRLLPIEDGPWVIEGVCVSARSVANAKTQPPATNSIEFAFEGDDGWSVVIRTALRENKVWQAERWLRVHDCDDRNGRSEMRVMTLFSEWAEAL